MLACKLKILGIIIKLKIVIRKSYNNTLAFLYIYALNSYYKIKAVRSGGVYHKVDDNDKRKPVRFKSSLVDFKAAEVSFNHLEKAFEKNSQEWLKVKGLVNHILIEKDKITLSKFSRALHANGVTAIVYKNDKAVYGIGYNYKSK